eukprot:1159149-Pelagomonas_calceolata.AAC.3
MREGRRRVSLPAPAESKVRTFKFDVEREISIQFWQPFIRMLPSPALLIAGLFSSNCQLSYSPEEVWKVLTEPNAPDVFRSIKVLVVLAP